MVFASSTAESALTSSLPADILTMGLLVSPLFHRVDEEKESMPSDENLMTHKRRSVDVGDTVARAIDLTIDDFVICEMTTVILEDDIELASDVLISLEAVEGVPLPFAVVRAEGSAAMASDNLQHDGPLTLQPANYAPLSAIGKGKIVVEDGCEIGSDLDAYEMRMMEEGLIARGETGGVHEDHHNPHGSWSIKKHKERSTCS